MVSEAASIRANPQGKKIGSVIEAELDKGKGVIATLLVQNGELEMGDVGRCRSGVWQNQSHVRLQRPPHSQSRTLHHRFQ